MTIDYERRDRVLRAYILGRDWDENPEYLLKRTLVVNGDPHLARYPFLFDDEWEVEAGATNAGKGDLVFADGHGRFAIVEVKHLPALGSGRNRGAKRNDKRNAVKEQARRYAAHLLARLAVAEEVVAMMLTDDWMGAGVFEIAVLRREDHPFIEPWRPPAFAPNFAGLVRSGAVDEGDPE